MALQATRGGPPLARGRYWLLIALTAMLFLWPKYVTVGPAGLRLSPYNLLVLVSFATGFTLVFRRDRNVAPLGSLGWATVAVFGALYLLRFVTDLFLVGTGGLYLDIRDFMWQASPFLLGLMLGNQYRGLESVSTTICVCILVLCLIGIVEHVAGKAFPALILFNLQLNIDPAYASQLVADKVRDANFRAQGTLVHPIVFGEVAAATAAIALGRLVSGNGNRLLSVSAVVAAIICAFLAGSRSAQVALIVGMIIFFLLQIAISRKPTVWVVAIACLPFIIAGIAFAYGYVADLAAGRSAAEQMSSRARASQWALGYPEFLKAPLFGHGAGSSLVLAGIKGSGSVYTVDDYVLSLLIEVGLIGVVLLIVWIALTGLQVLAADTTPEQRRLRTGYFAGICAIAIGQKAVSITEGLSYAWFFGGLITATSGLGRPRVRALFPSARQTGRVA